MVTRDWLTKFAVGSLVLGLVLVGSASGAPLDACGAGVGMVGVNPVLNGAMTLGTEHDPTSEGTTGDVVRQLASAAGGLSETNAYFGVAAWTISVVSEDRMPHSDAGWSDHHGTSGSGVAWVHYDARDADHEAVSIRQMLGQADAGGVYCNADEVTLDLVSDGAVDVVVGIHTAERPHMPYFSDTVRIGIDGGQGDPAMPPGAPFEAPWARTDVVLDVDAVGTLTMIEVLVNDVGDGSSDGSWVFVDNVAVFGTSAVPVPL